MDNRKPLLGKILLTGTIQCLTGLHIGGSDSELAIGGIDSTVIRDPLTGQPYIPGSSLKGKLRSLLERSLNKEFNRSGGRDIFRHECTDPNCPVCRLFGATAGREDKEGNLPARILVRDAHLTPESLAELDTIEGGLPYTEWKTENGLDRITCAANPRQIERVPAGARFIFDIVYTAEDAVSVKDDLANLLSMLRLLEDDALGGGGSRGNGRVAIRLEKTVVRVKGYYLEQQDEETIVPDTPHAEIPSKIQEIISRVAV